jgi:hypothetical protein
MIHRRKLRALAPVLVGLAWVSCAREDNTAGPVGPVQAPAAYAPAPAPEAPPPDPYASAALAEIGPLDAIDPGQRVLLTGEKIAFVEKRVMTGGCWDFANAVYAEAGFPQKQRRVVFQGKKKGPFAKADVLRPGDWIMHVNREAAGIEHSSIFVRWIDLPSRLALTLDYAGMNRPTPGRLSRHDYSRVYTVLRPKEVK